MLKNSRSFALELLQRLCENNTDMTDSDGIKITKYVCETQISLTTPCKTSPFRIGLTTTFPGFLSIQMDIVVFAHPAF